MDTQYSTDKESKEKDSGGKSIKLKRAEPEKAAPVYFPNDELPDEAFQRLNR